MLLKEKYIRLKIIIFYYNINFKIIFFLLEIRLPMIPILIE